MDDLDRCGDKDILRIMKTVNYLSSIKNLYIIMAVDKNKVIDAIQREYKNERNGDKGSRKRAKKYIEKIFQISINIPDINSNFTKNENFKLTELEKKVYECFDKTREIKKFILKYAIFLIIGVLVYFYHPFINKNYNNLVLFSQKLEITNIKVPTKDIDVGITEENNNTKTTKIPPTLNSKTKIPPTLNNKTTTNKYIIPVKRDKTSLIQNAIRYMEVLNIWIIMLVMGFIMLGSFFIYKNRKESEEKDAYILSEANKISKTPRQAKMIYNQVKAITLIGKKDFYFQHTLFTLFRDGLLNFIFKSLIYLYIIIPYLLKHIKLHKFNEYHNELLSMLLGSSKTKQDFKDFEKEISYIMSYIQGEVDGNSFFLKDKLSVIQVRQYNAILPAIRQYNATLPAITTI
jgi:hypothetical protein